MATTRQRLYLKQLQKLTKVQFSKSYLFKFRKFNLLISDCKI